MAGTQRTFDYSAVEGIYSEMNKIIGDNGTSDSLCGLLTDIDKNYHDMVGVVDEACYGALADQLKLDWENTSSNFPSFIQNFQNWSALVAVTSDKYAQFEQEVNGMQDANKYGFAGAGLTSNYIQSSTYNAYAANNMGTFDSAVANLSSIYDITGATYNVSGASDRLKTQHVMNTILAGGDALSIAVIASGAYSILNPATASSTELAVVEQGGAVATTEGAAGATGATSAAGSATSGATPLLESGAANATGAAASSSGVSLESMNAIRNAARAGKFASKSEAKAAVAKLFGLESAGMIKDGSLAHSFLVEILKLMK